jgi:hypothetical protein
MIISRKLPAALLIPAGITLATLAGACGGEPAKSPNTSSAADATSTSTTSAPELNGTYKVTGETTGISTWTVTPCGGGCADVAVRSESANETGDTLALPFTGQAHLKNDEWSMAIFRTDGYECEDGTYSAVDAIYSWNATSLKGSWDATLHGPGCGEPAGSGTGPPESFTLIKVR